jgi:hypothetical protein
MKVQLTYELKFKLKTMNEQFEYEKVPFVFLIEKCFCEAKLTFKGNGWRRLSLWKELKRF